MAHPTMSPMRELSLVLDTRTHTHTHTHTQNILPTLFDCFVRILLLEQVWLS